MKNSVIVISLYISALILSLCNCSTDNVIAPTEKPQGNFIGKVCDIQGKPVEGATVMLVPENYLPRIPDNNQITVNSTMSNASGYFGFNVEHSGKYNLLANNQQHYSLHSSILVNSSSQIELPEEQLLEPGSLSGSIELEGANDNQSAVLLIIGTNRFTSPSDSLGSFTVSSLAQGDYKLRFLSKESGFGVVETTITITSGEQLTIPRVTLSRSRIAKIDNFNAAFDPFMMSATLTWTTNDTDIIDSFYIFYNRNNNFTPIRTTANNVFSTLIDLIGYPRDSLAFQIVPIMHNSKEGTLTECTPIVNKSAVNVVSVDTLLSSFLTLRYKTLYHFSENGHYIVESLLSDSSHITKLDVDFNVKQETDIEGCTITTKYFNMSKKYNPTGTYNVIGSDGQGNLFMLIQKSDSLNCTEIVKLDTGLTIRKRHSLSSDSGWPHYSIAVSSSGSVMLFKPTVNDTTTAIIFDHELNTVSEVMYKDYRAITSYFSSNDTVCVKIYKRPNYEYLLYDNQFNYEYLLYDNLFNEVENINIREIEVVAPFPAKMSGNKNIAPTMVSHNLILSGTYQTIMDTSVWVEYLFNRQGTCKVRSSVIGLPYNDFDFELFHDNKKHLYFYSKYNGYLLRYTIAE